MGDLDTQITQIIDYEWKVQGASNGLYTLDNNQKMIILKKRWKSSLSLCFYIREGMSCLIGDDCTIACICQVTDGGNLISSFLLIAQVINGRFRNVFIYLVVFLFEWISKDNDNDGDKNKSFAINILCLPSIHSQFRFDK